MIVDKSHKLKILRKQCPSAPVVFNRSLHSLSAFTSDWKEPTHMNGFGGCVCPRNLPFFPGIMVLSDYNFT